MTSFAPTAATIRSPGGGGNDWLEGGYGNDTYLFDAAFGRDTVQHYYTNAGDTDTLRFGEGLSLENMRFSLANSDKNLVLSFADSTDRIEVTNLFTDRGKELNLSFADGTQLDKAGIREKLYCSPEN